MRFTLRHDIHARGEAGIQSGARECARGIRVGCGDENEMEGIARHYLPMQKRCFSERMKRLPWEIAMEAWHFSFREFLARMPLNSGAASIMEVSPASERK